MGKDCQPCAKHVIVQSSNQETGKWSDRLAALARLEPTTSGEATRGLQLSSHACCTRPQRWWYFSEFTRLQGTRCSIWQALLSQPTCYICSWSLPALQYSITPTSLFNIQSTHSLPALFLLVLTLHIALYCLFLATAVLTSAFAPSYKSFRDHQRHSTLKHHIS
jgi:hypothetical protein